jgi:hypothetical protein
MHSTNETALNAFPTSSAQSRATIDARQCFAYHTVLNLTRNFPTKPAPTDTTAAEE